jgi:hypothetical protein
MRHGRASLGDGAGTTRERPDGGKRVEMGANPESMINMHAIGQIGT